MQPNLNQQNCRYNLVIDSHLNLYNLVIDSYLNLSLIFFHKSEYFSDLNSNIYNHTKKKIPCIFTSTQGLYGLRSISLFL